LSLVKQFMARFAGLPRAYGTYQITEEKESGKKTGKAVTRRESVTEELWQLHLDGKQNLGIVPVRDDGTCVFGAIDIDSYKDFDVAGLAAKVAQLKLPLAPCRSKSGGCHLYLFAAEPVQASLMRARLGEFAKTLGYPTAEIFPKQDRIDPERNDVGGWINLPYAAASGTCVRFMVRPDGSRYSPTEFLEEAGRLAQGQEFFETPFKVINRDAYFPEGPPCLQSLVQIAMPEGTRNNGFLNVAVYLKKAFPDDWRERSRDYAARFFDPPLRGEEVTTTIGSVAKHNYRYGCKKEPLQALCNSAVCRTRRYGVGYEDRQVSKEEDADDGGMMPMPVFGQLRFMQTEPPRWKLTVADKEVDLTTAQLASPREFQKRLMETARIVMPIPTQDAWQRILQDLLNHSIEIEVPAGDNTQGSDFWELMEKYLTTKSPAQQKEQVATGSPWTEDGYTWFTIPGFKRFLKRASADDFENNQITAFLVERSTTKYAEWPINGKNVWVWAIPELVRPKVIDDELPEVAV